MFTPRSAPDSEPVVATLKPIEVLYYYDEPIIFRTDSRFSPLLCNKMDEANSINQYLAVQTNDKIISDLRNGKISVRAAFSQPWCWLIETDSSYNVEREWSLDPDSLPPDFFPDPGYGIYPHHGQIEETNKLSTATPFLSMNFRGGILTDGILSLRIFKTLLDDAYSAIWDIFTPAIHDLFATENLLRRVVNIPVRQPVFSSLRIEIERPILNLSILRADAPKIDLEATNTKISTANDQFLESANDIAVAAQSGQLSNRVADSNLSALAIVSQLAPNERSPYDILEISGRRIKDETTSVRVGTAAGTALREAYKRALLETRIVKGVVVEISARSSTFITRTERFREVTCIPTTGELHDEIGQLATGAEVSMSGQYEERTRRDKLYMDSLRILSVPGSRQRRLF